MVFIRYRQNKKFLSIALFFFLSVYMENVLSLHESYITARQLDYREIPGPGFIFDDGETLTFTLMVLFPANPEGTVIATPFVTTPYGETLKGETVTIDSEGDIVFEPIAVLTPAYGFYNFGLIIINSSSTKLSGITLRLITDSRDKSITNELIPKVSANIEQGKIEIFSTFSYDFKDILYDSN